MAAAVATEGVPQVGRHFVDHLYRKLILTGFFKEGWGATEHMEMILEMRRRFFAQRDPTVPQLLKDYPIHFEKMRKYSDCRIVEGHFESPVDKFLPGLLPEECRIAHFQMVLPLERQVKQPVCLHLGGTGDHFFWKRRLLLAKPLAKQHGIASI
eukprot:Colp12_sorted_trinity150504_noHs@32653